MVRRRLFLKSVIGGLSTFLVLPSDIKATEDTLNSEDRKSISIYDKEDLEMSLVVTIEKVNYFECTGELQIDCQGHTVFNDDLKLELYFSKYGHLELAKTDLKEGSKWFVSGLFGIIEGGVTLYGPEYRALNAEEKERYS